MTNRLLEQIFQRSAKALVGMGAEAEDEILSAIAENAEEAQAQGKNALVMTLNHAIRIDLGKSGQKDSLSFRVSHKIEREGRLDDPDQDEMDLGS